MRRHLFFFLLCAAFPLPSFAACFPNAQNCIGQPCATPGQTVMDFDKQNLIACLCDGACLSGNYKWKAMTSVDVSCPANQAMTGFVNGKPVCSMTLVDAVATCPSGQIITSINNGQVQCTQPGKVCNGWCVPYNNMVDPGYYRQVLRCW